MTKNILNYDEKIISTAIDMFVKCGLEEKAYQIYKEMELKYKIKPGFITINSIVGYLIKIMKIEDVFEIIKPFIETNRLNEIMWIVSLHSCSKLNDKDKCNRLYEVFQSEEEEEEEEEEAFLILKKKILICLSVHGQEYCCIQ